MAPLIAITTGTGQNLPKHAERYTEAVRNAGGLAEFVYPGTGRKGLYEHFDGFLIPGGKDILPVLYNEKQQCAIEAEERKRTEFELEVLRGAVLRRKPLLGICYGMQVMNIFFRGTLYQDILEQKEGSSDHRTETHGIEVLQNPFISEGETVVNSSHHQAVRKPGRGLAPMAWSKDGVLEAIYLSDYPFLVGVQWHPERMEGGASAEIIKAFIGAGRVR